MVAVAESEGDVEKQAAREGWDAGFNPVAMP
jgi:hypothetical protein